MLVLIGGTIARTMSVQHHFTRFLVTVPSEPPTILVDLMIAHFVFLRVIESLTGDVRQIWGEVALFYQRVQRFYPYLSKGNWIG